ncbi:hypothetical protein Nepgr_024625 [Nepenthes gracilis]|uniref:Uncharacterized protein n=1 Tax=Nepenthes gracilis TaxID=150966 RepID=A0AAD3XYS9_NEPGR|nr:hypothetical protein Nepgr_024625 [Nepenthes gracilis]
MEMRSIEAEIEKKPDKLSARYNPINDKVIHASTSLAGKAPSFSDYPKQTTDFLDQVMMATEDDDDDDDDDNDNEDEVEKGEEVGCNGAIDGAPDVDKKADEFIAKFREQIRLQRIESIKRSTKQLKTDAIK